MPHPYMNSPNDNRRQIGMPVQDFPQQTHGFSYLIFNSFYRNTELFRNFPVGELIEATEGKNNAAFFR